MISLECVRTKQVKKWPRINNNCRRTRIDKKKRKNLKKKHDAKIQCTQQYNTAQAKQEEGKNRVYVCICICICICMCCILVQIFSSLKERTVFRRYHRIGSICICICMVLLQYVLQYLARTRTRFFV
jgi:hypothetical protein